MTALTSPVRMEGHVGILMETTPASAPHRMLESSASYVCSPTTTSLHFTHFPQIYNTSCHLLFLKNLDEIGQMTKYYYMCIECNNYCCKEWCNILNKYFTCGLLQHVKFKDFKFFCKPWKIQNKVPRITFFSSTIKL